MTITEIATAPPVDAGLRAIFNAQRAAFRRADAPTLQERRANLKRLGVAIRENAGALASAISADFGNRSRHETEIGEVLPVLTAIRHARRHVRDWMRPKPVPVPPELLPGRARILYQPVGVVGIISPWNYPFQLAVAPLIAALSAGNRVMLKPSELTPRTADFLAELLAALFPADQVATVLGGPETGRAFAALPFDHLFYTGSTAVGRLVMKAAAENLTPVTLELGGKSPCILAEDAALPGAVESIVYGKLLNSGQTCIAPDYVLLPERRLDEFIKLATGTIAKFYPALATNPDYSSIIDERHYQRLEQYIAEAKASGARVVEINPGHETLSAETRKLPPTLVDRSAKTISPSCARRFLVRCCRSRPIAVSTRRSITSTAARGRWRCIISAPTVAGAMKCCGERCRAEHPSTQHCFISPWKIFRSAESAPRASVLITASSVSRRSPTERRCFCRAASTAYGSSIRPLGA